MNEMTKNQQPPHTEIHGTQSSADFILILCTFPDEKTASTILLELLKDCFIACANLCPQITSLYHWNGHIESTKEVLGLLKTTRENFQAVEEKIKKMHPYEIPEIIAVPIQYGNHDYLAWILKEVTPKINPVIKTHP